MTGFDKLKELWPLPWEIESDENDDSETYYYSSAIGNSIIVSQTPKERDWTIHLSFDKLEQGFSNGICLCQWHDLSKAIEFAKKHLNEMFYFAGHVKRLEEIHNEFDKKEKNNER